MSFLAYSSYRPSGIEMLGDLPSHWATAPIKAVATWNDEVLKEDTEPDFELEYVEISDVQAGAGVTGSTSYIFSEAPSRARRRVRHEDILVSTVRTYLRAISQVDSPPENLIASTGFAVLRPSNIASSFLGYAVEAEPTISEIIARSVGVSYPAINASDLVRIVLPVPPPAEQAAIAAFLDRETSKIDALVDEQRQLIGLLTEKRQAVISHAVTKGLDPTVPMKDSGTEWLGEIPAHWRAGALKHFINPRRRLTYGIVQAGPDTPGGIPYIRPADMRDEDGVLDETSLLRTTPEIAGAYQRSAVQHGDLVCSIGPSFGKVMEVPTSLHGANLTQGTARVAVREGVVSRFIFWALRCRNSMAQWEASVGGATFRALNLEPLANTIVALPPISDQTAISTFLDQETAKLDALMADAGRTISLIRERRAALISAAVTGKIDVREAASPSETAEAA